MRLLSTLLPCCFALIACLDAKPGGSSDRETTDTSSPADTAETNAETTAEVGPDSSDPCANLVCDDRDPCTVDSCIDGACYSVQLTGAAAPPEPPECDTDAACDDGDTSTIDICQQRTDECGVSTWAYCEHLQPNPCFDNDVDCSDGNLCTFDYCDTTLGCVYEPVGEGLCDSSCGDRAGACMDTIGDAILGRYLGTFEVEGTPLVKFDAAIVATTAGYAMTIADVRGVHAEIQLDLAAFAEQRPRVTDGFSNEGRVTTQLVLPWVNAEAETESIVLFPSGNRLAGRAGPLFHTASEGHGALPPEQEDTLPYGRLLLERLP